MKFVGKITGKELKDFGKGKDAQAEEVVFVTARLDGVGRAGKISFEAEEGVDYELGDTINVSVEMRQQKLGLKGRGARAGAPAEH